MLIVGAKGFAKELLEVICQNNLNEEIVFYDDISNDLPDLLFERYRIIRDKDSASEYLNKIDNRFALGVSNPQLRKVFFEKFTELGGKALTVVSPLAKIGNFGNEISAGVSILTNVVIESDNKIGKGCLIHVGSFISHETLVGEFCEISPFVKLLGNVSIGDFCSLGTNCVILPKVRVGNNVVVGAGAVVNRDVQDNMTVVGIPAKPLLK